MKRAFVASSLMLLASLTLAACRSSNDGATADAQRDFGVRMARMNLWREAMFRFKRAVDLNPGDAMAHNNLAVAYEANGDFDKAAEAYRTAIRLDKSNQHIQRNYSRFVEFTSRNKKRQQPAARAAGAAATATTTATDAPPSAAPPTDVTPAGTPTPGPAGGTPTPGAPTAAPSPAPTGATPAAIPTPPPAPAPATTSNPPEGAE